VFLTLGLGKVYNEELDNLYSSADTGSFSNKAGGGGVNLRTYLTFEERSVTYCSRRAPRKKPLGRNRECERKNDAELRIREAANGGVDCNEVAQDMAHWHEC